MTDHRPSSASDPLIDWRETILKCALHLAGGISLLWLVVVGMITPGIVFSWFGVIFTLLLAIIWAAALVPGIPRAWRNGVFLGFCYLTALSGLCYFGPAAGNAVLCLMFALFITVQWGLAAGLGAIALLVVTWVAAGAGWMQGWLPPADSTIRPDPHVLDLWIRQGLATFAVAVAFVVLVHFAVRWFIRYVETAEATAARQRESDARFRELFDHAQLGIYRTTPDGTVVAANPALLAILGWDSVEKLSARNQAQGVYLRPDDRRRVRETLERDGEVRGFETEWVRRDGQVIAIREDARAIRDGAGRVVFFDGTVEDVTIQRRAEAARGESEERFRQVVEAIAEVFWIIDPENDRVIYVSPSFERVWGRPCADVYRSPSAWADSLHPDDRDWLLDVIRRRRNTEGYDEIYRILRRDGSVRWVRDRCYPVKDAAGRTVRCVGAAEDITERKDMEEHLLHRQRLEAIGTLASGVAHDLNNILTPLLMASGVLREKLAAPADQELMSLVESEARRGAAIVNQLLTFSRGVVGRRAPVQPGQLVREMAHIMRETFPRNIAVVEEVAENVGQIDGDATQLHQVLMNLCVNARDAMPTGGAITLRAENSDLGGQRSSQNPWAKSGPFVVLTVSDTGQGIPPQLRSRIFDPFFTTKEVGKGTGLGLSTVHGIVRSHDGFVTVASEPGRGAAFRVFLPASREAAPVRKEEARVHIREGRGQLILLIDDEQSVLKVTKRILENNGYQVIVAADGEEGLRAFQARRHDVRLVITDMMMPGLDGTALVPLLREVAPAVRIIGVSGMDQRHRAAQLAELGFSETLMKPYEPDTLLEAVGRQLHAAGAATPVDR